MSINSKNSKTSRSKSKTKNVETKSKRHLSKFKEKGHKR